MAQAKWLVLIDWNGNGSFPDAAEDVSADVIDLTLEHFRDLQSGYVEAARAELRLRNEGHRYSPPNAKSPLHANLKPGRGLLVRAAYPYDGFSGSPAGTRLASHAPELGAAYRWTESAQGFRIAAGGAAETDGVSGSVARTATLALGADVSFGCDFTRGANATRHGGLCIRYSNASNYLYVRVTGQAVELRKVDAGAHSTLATAAHAWPSAARRFVQVVTHGQSVRMFVDDRQLIDATTSFNATATRHGLYCDGGAAHKWHGFGGWASLFRGVVDTIHPRPRLGAQYCYVRALDDAARLTSVTLHTQATAAYPQTSDEILGDVLDRSGADADRRRLDTGAALVPSLWSPPLWGVRAMDEIYRLQDEEDGLIYVDGHGFWRLESRSHRKSAPHTSHVATIGDAERDGNPYFSELVWDDGVNNVENTLFMHVRGATYHGHRTAWALSEKPYFAANETKLFLAESADYDMVIGQLRPSKYTDFTANTKQNGTGVNLTNQVTVSLPLAARVQGQGHADKRHVRRDGWLPDAPSDADAERLRVRRPGNRARRGRHERCGLRAARKAHRCPLDTRDRRSAIGHRQPVGAPQAAPQRGAGDAEQRQRREPGGHAATRLFGQGAAALPRHGHRRRLLHRGPQAERRRGLDPRRVRVVTGKRGLKSLPLNGGSTNNPFPLDGGRLGWG